MFYNVKYIFGTPVIKRLTEPAVLCLRRYPEAGGHGVERSETSEAEYKRASHAGRSDATLSNSHPARLLFLKYSTNHAVGIGRAAVDEDVIGLAGDAGLGRGVDHAVARW